MTRAVVTWSILLLAASEPAAARIERVKVRSLSGDVRVTGSTKAKRVTGTGPIVIKERGGEVKVVGTDPDDPVTLTVPSGVELDVKTRSGDISISGVTGAVRVRSVSSRLRVKGARGVDVKSVSGSVRLEQVTGRLRVKTVSGTIRASGKLSEIDVTTVSGSVTLDQLAGPGKVRTTSGEVKLSGTLGKGARARIRSHSGHVTARLRVPAGAEYAMRSYSGDLELKPGSKAKTRRIEERRAEGAVGKGGASLELSTFSGDITLHLRE
jgi:DUF4097 and DUF4098 domain-containing protein YvlB